MTKEEILQAFKKAEKRYTITWLDYIFKTEKSLNYGLCHYFLYDLGFHRYELHEYLTPYWIKYRTREGKYHFNNNRERLKAIKKVIKDLENEKLHH